MEKENMNPEVIRNLQDAGCDEETISQFLACCQSGSDRQSMKLLKQHRRCLLEQIHDDEHRIDCLDYLVDQLEKAKKQNEITIRSVDLIRKEGKNNE